MINKPLCYHCGEICREAISFNDKSFCCQGCRQVYRLLSENDLCRYYQLDEHPGIKAMGKFTDGRFAYLDDDDVLNSLALFRDTQRINIEFSLPQMHCASCVFLLEKINRFDQGIIQSRVNFQRQTLFVSYNPQQTSLRKIVELLAFIGYEPAISLQDSISKKPSFYRKKETIRIGIAGFCFSNIMMMSFPEYFSGGFIETAGLQRTFSWIIFALSLPVLFYSAIPFFKSAWSGLRQKEINIDAPIVLATSITFARSYYEIITGSGSGYLDSGTGIIFFMLIGRWFQHKTYDTLSFDRKYQSYFPLGVTIWKNNIEKNIPITKVMINDVMVTRHQEMIPADSILMSDAADIDYSFVNGENTTQHKVKGDLIYAGGKQSGGRILSQVVKLPSQSYITELWNNEIFNKSKSNNHSFVHPWSRHFTLVLFSIAISASIYWQIHQPSMVLTVLTSVLIVACPCSLLLTSTFTFGNMLRIFGANKCYLKNPAVIESLGKINDIVFDKTGTITTQKMASLHYKGLPLNDEESELLKRITAQSSHTLSRSLHAYLQTHEAADTTILQDFRELTGKGISAMANGKTIEVGNHEFVGLSKSHDHHSSEVHVSIDKSYKGYYEVKLPYRNGVQEMIHSLQSDYSLHLLSGDHDAEKNTLQSMFGNKASLCFSVTPKEKLTYIQALQQEGKHLMMVGDGLNDAGALMQAEVGIAVSENLSTFSPACDGIIDGESLIQLPKLLRYARAAKRLTAVGFAFSIAYNIVGISFAVQGKLAPVVAAILMPLSSITIVSLAFAITTWYAHHLKLNIQSS